jgi:hypothetical protein
MRKRRSKVKTIIKSRIQWPSLLGLALIGLRLGVGDLKAQTAVPNLQTSVEGTQTGQDLKIQQLQDKLEEIQKELMELKHANSAQPETRHLTTAKASVAAPNLTETQPEVTDPSSPHSEPFAFADFTWLTGNARTVDTPYATKFFTPEIRSDVNYTYDFRHPKDDTISGSSEIFRANEVQLTQFGVGGDFHYDNVRARLMTQFGLYSQTTPRNDASPACVGGKFQCRRSDPFC